jgi:succinate dehydrogenase / fumarate reductase membrane anchor subunit
MMSLRSPLSRVLGAGSAKEGTEHWWLQRVTAVALLLLGPWFLLALLSLDGWTRAELLSWAGRPANSVMLLLLGVTLARHSSLGVQVVIEDYVHGPGSKVVALVLSKFAHVLLGVAAVLAVLKIALGDTP